MSTPEKPRNSDITKIQGDTLAIELVNPDSIEKYLENLNELKEVVTVGKKDLPHPFLTAGICVESTKDQLFSVGISLTVDNTAGQQQDLATWLRENFDRDADQFEWTLEDYLDEDSIHITTSDGYDTAIHFSKQPTSISINICVVRSDQDDNSLTKYELFTRSLQLMNMIIDTTISDFVNDEPKPQITIMVPADAASEFHIAQAPNQLQRIELWAEILAAEYMNYAEYVSISSKNTFQAPSVPYSTSLNIENLAYSSAGFSEGDIRQVVQNQYAKLRVKQGTILQAMLLEEINLVRQR